MGVYKEQILGFKKDLDDVHNAGYEKGKAEIDAFMNIYQENGARYHWNSAFANKGWNDDTFGMLKTYTNPTTGNKYRIGEIRYANAMFQTSTITKITDPLDFTSLASQPSSVFYACTSLKEITAIYVNEITTFNNWFVSCVSLKKIQFKGAGRIANSINFQNCPALEATSAISTLYGLVDHSTTPVDQRPTIYFPPNVWTNMNKQTTYLPSGLNSWEEYVESKGWKH